MNKWIFNNSYFCYFSRTSFDSIYNYIFQGQAFNVCIDARRAIYKFALVNALIQTFLICSVHFLFRIAQCLNALIACAYLTIKLKNLSVKKRSKRRGQNWANQTHKRNEIKFSDHHFLIYANVICRFCIFLMCTRHIRKMQKLQIWYGYIKKWWSENFISFLLCVWLAQFLPTALRSVF